MRGVEIGLISVCVAILAYGLFFGARTPAPQARITPQQAAPQPDGDHCAPGVLGSPCWTNQNGMPGMPGTKWK